MRELAWLLVLEAALTGCVVETELARRSLPDAADAAPSATDAAVEDAREDASPAMDGMATMDGPMDCDGHDCDAAADSGGDSPEGMATP